MLQEAKKLFYDVNEFVHSDIPDQPEQRTKNVDFVVECNFVELVQNIWRRFKLRKRLEENQDLPTHIQTSLDVKIYTRVFTKLRYNLKSRQ